MKNIIFKIESIKNIDINYSDNLKEEFYNRLSKDNDELVKLLDLNKSSKYVLINSKIISKSDLYNTITIDKGYSDGIILNDSVINNNRYIGYVSNVFKNFSEINININKTIVKIKNKKGIISYNIKYNSYIIDGINDLKDIKKGNKVYTSDDLYIGNVSDILEDDNGIKRLIKINIDNNEYNYVSVIIK